MPTPIVIDLSHHNIVSRDLKAARASGIIGLIHKATEGATVKDSKCVARGFMAREAGMMFGLYHFIRPGSVEKQVANFVGVYNGFGRSDILVALDYEDMGVSLDMCEDWLDAVQLQLSKLPVIYSGHVLKEKLGRKAHPRLNGENFPLWLAQYSIRPTFPPGWKNALLWQYSEKGEVPGIIPPTDLNAGEEARVREFWGGELPGATPPASKEEIYRQALEDIRRRADEALGG
jgi:lysozyme